jgi:NADH-quinone oxidoreductase subunit C
MTQKLDKLEAALTLILGDAIQSLVRARGEITITVAAARYLETAQLLRDEEALKFEQLIDLCGALCFAELACAAEGLCHRR